MAYISFQPNDYFNTKLYTGNATDDTAITGVGFTPSFLWGKNRTDAGTNHFLIDAVRGVTKEINSNNTDAQGTDATLIKSFDSDGFTLGDGSLNQSAKNFVTWNWKASGTSGSSNSDGSISSTVSANDTAGFSIVKYTGTGSAGNVGHGLSTAPKVLINKSISGANDWFVGHSSIGFTKFLKLNATNAESTNSGIWNDTAPTTDHFTINSANGNTNGTGIEYITYCFAEKKGFSKFGSYVGNGSADGSFIYLGFKPAFVLIKDYGRAESWYIFDNRRLGYNGAMADFLANTTAAESSSSATLLDFFSNGFKLTGTTDHLNGNGQNFLYMAFAEEPLVSSNGVPAVAR